VRQAESFEIKRLLPNRTPLDRNSRGLAITRPVRVKPKTYIGNEDIVGLNDANELLTAEMLAETESTYLCLP
jgi:hypothetical protein